MKLTYRGNTYESNPLQSNAGRSYSEPYQLTYRGATYFSDPAAQFARPSALQISYQLIYRGVAYIVNSLGQTKPVLPAATSPAAMSRQVRVPNALPQDAIARVHQANILRSLQHRIQVAEARGDRELINLLESELRQVS